MSKKPMYLVKCGKCGREFPLPFPAHPDRPILCPECFFKQDQESGTKKDERKK